MAASGTCSGGALLLAGALLAIFIPVHTMHKSLKEIGVTPEYNLTEANLRICKSVDVRNTVKKIEEALRGCRVVEGYVKILLFDKVNESEFNNISFPELREITDYLLLYRVTGLRSIGQLFPNLAVIRGQEKFNTYSLIIYEMSSLREIGLHSLTDISSGLIRIDKNPSLCYVNSIDWNRIAHEKGENYISMVKDEKECPLCPGDDDSSENQCELYKSSTGSTERRLCWNRQHCQKICPAKCEKSCDSKGMCCDKSCLGGCEDGKPDHCFVCKNLTMNTGSNYNTCMDHCPADRYKYLNRRCITRDECINFRKHNLPSKIQNPYKIYNNESCVLDCPTNYMDDYEKHRCVPCSGNCKKECPGGSIDTIATAKSWLGCTHINGSLEIQIKGGNKVVEELTTNLGMIEEIDGYIKIVRSFPLISLSFLKSLRVIRGNGLDNQNSSFIVLDNQNLQDIWEWENRTLRIDNGRLFFHFNPKLCLEKIQKLEKMANLSEFNTFEVDSNGEKVACNVHELKVDITKKGSRTVILRWDPFKLLKDHRKLLGYVIYYIEAKSENVTIYDGRDACGGDKWQVNDVPVPVNDTTIIDHLLSHLTPYTKYAFYVKTYTIASERTGAQSSIQYFRTLPDEPSLPDNIIVHSRTNSSFVISWNPPYSPNGNVTHYIITGKQRIENKTSIINSRNYCSTSSPTGPTKQETPQETNQQNKTCDCKEPVKPHSSYSSLEDLRANQIKFEDRLHNFVYVKKQPISNRDKSDGGSRRKRDGLGEFPADSGEKKKGKNKNNIGNHTDADGRYTAFTFQIYGTSLLVNKLKHYTEYELLIQACREKEEHETANECGDTAIRIARTNKNEFADDLVNLVHISTSENNATFNWTEPAEPNGPIVAYLIEYQRTDIEGSDSVTRCISSAQYLRDKKYTLQKLNPGNYVLRVLAKSVDFKGNPKEIAFTIEQTSGSAVVYLVITFSLLAFLGLGMFYVKKRYFPHEDIRLITTVNPEYVSTSYEPDEWEMNRSEIQLLKELGQGSFGMVYEGVAIKDKVQIRCAIKTVNVHSTNRERIEFLNEASVMKGFDTAHVVKLLGVVSQGQPTFVVMELMANGDLKTYLRSHRPDIYSDERPNSRQPPTLKRILQMAIEIADGMAYLSAKKFVHRDLAARNCMVAEDLTVKIGDFGMTRDIYETDYYRKGTKGLLPVRWMAPESLKDGVFTSSSDVWSYGVVLWEMATLASQPYQGLSNDQVLRYVIGGGIMERPENCPDKLYNLMMYCWRHDPTDRPTFINLCILLLEDSCKQFCEISFYHSAAGMEARNSRSRHNTFLQDDPSTPLRRNQGNENCSLTNTDESDQEELDNESNIEFKNYPSMTNYVSSTANGYVAARTNNGTT